MERGGERRRERERKREMGREVEREKERERWRERERWGERWRERRREIDRKREMGREVEREKEREIERNQILFSVHEEVKLIRNLRDEGRCFPSRMSSILTDLSGPIIVDTEMSDNSTVDLLLVANSCKHGHRGRAMHCHHGRVMHITRKSQACNQETVVVLSRT